MVEKDLIQGLKEGGIDKESLDMVRTYLRSGNQKGVANVITGCRRKCLDELHEDQKRIDLLDYLLYQMGNDKQS